MCETAMGQKIPFPMMIWSAIFLEVFRHAYAQVDPPQPQPIATLPVIDPNVIQPPNLPACLTEWTDFMKDMATAVNGIIDQTVLCAYELGWYGETPIGDLTDGTPTIWNKKVGPFHDQRTCPFIILVTISKFASSISDLEASMFDCFNINQACGQSIASASKKLLEGGQKLINAAEICGPPGSDAPWYRKTVLPDDGFNCWGNVWSFVQRLVESAKFIDVACATCPDPTADSAPIPEPAADVAPSPEPVASNNVDSASASANDVPSPEPATDDQSSSTALLASAWAGLEQPEPFARLGSQIVERRLSTPEILEHFDDQWGHIDPERLTANNVDEIKRFFVAIVGGDVSLNRPIAV